jgi:DNA-binding beta-propeller fold protein YncE
VTDTLNHCIRKISPAGVVTTIAGVPKTSGYKDGAAASALFLEPSGIAVSADGSVIYVADTGNHLIRKIENGSVTTVAGFIGEKDEDGYPVGGFNNGAAARAMFNQPKGLALADGTLVIADSGNHMIRVLDSVGNVSTLCGSGEPGDEGDDVSGAVLNTPSGVVVRGGDLYIADTLNNKIKVVVFDR